MSIELLLFCAVLVLTAICLLLSLLVMRNYAQLRELREQIARLDARLATRAARAAARVAAASSVTEDEGPSGERAPEEPLGLRLIRPAALEAEIRALADEGKVLEAVQRYRRETGVSLRAAHEAVQHILEA